MANPIYNIEFTVGRTPPKVSPTDPQQAGFFGDDGFASVRFHLQPSDIVAGHRYRIEVEDANGAYDITELLDADENGIVYYLIPTAWTTAGIANIRLVEVEILGDKENAVLHYPSAKLRFEPRETGVQMGDMLPRWQTVMAESVEATRQANASAYEAEIAALTAREAAEAARQAKGPKGDKGDKGDPGPAGPQGPKGEKGDPGDGGGESNSLVVTISENTPSHSSQEIYAAYQDGKAVFLYVNERLLNITSATSEQVDFEYTEPVTLKYEQHTIMSTIYSLLSTPYEVPSDTTLTSYTLPANAAAVGERLGDIETALDGIITLQEGLIGGDNQ